MDSSLKTVGRIAALVVGAAVLAPLAYYGAAFTFRDRCPKCDADLDIVKRPGKWDPDLYPCEDSE